MKSPSTIICSRPSVIEQEVLAGGRIGIDQRLHLYLNAYRVGLTDTPAR